MKYAKMQAFTVTVPITTPATVKAMLETAIGGPLVLSTSKMNINAMHFQIETQGVRYCPDGNAPTQTTGIRYTATGEVAPVISTGNILALLFVSSTGTAAKMTIFLGESEAIPA